MRDEAQVDAREESESSPSSDSDNDAGQPTGGVTTELRSIPLEPLVRARDAYREAFDQEPGNVTAASSMGEFRVSVMAPYGQPIRGRIPSRNGAYEHLIALLTSLKPASKD
jgi:hypothetical protein